MNQDKYLHSVANTLSFIRSPVWIFDVDRLSFVWGNLAALDLWGASTLDDLRSREVAQDISHKVKSRLHQFCDDLNGTTESFLEHWTFYPHGRPSTYECSINSLEPLCGGRWLMVNAVEEYKGASSDTLFRSAALLHTSVCVSIYSIDGLLQYANPAARSMLRTQSVTLEQRFMDPDQWKKTQETLEHGDEVEVEAEVLTGQGYAWHNLTLERCPNPITGHRAIMVSETDITDRRQAQLLVNKLAYFDALTGLPNRESWFATLEQRMLGARQTDKPLTVLFIDLDKFKIINDTLGHVAGDKLLVAIARKLRRCIEANDYLARLGGDEFTMLIDDDASGGLSTSRAQSIIDTLSSPISINSSLLTIIPSIGMSTFPLLADKSDELMRQADIATDAAKKNGGGILLFNPDMMMHLQRQRLIERDLMDAIATEALRIYYQPKLCGATGVVLGFEALLRWEHPDLGWVNPEEVVAVAEEIGKVSEITRYMLHGALLQQLYWSQSGHPVSVAVNVSPTEFSQGGIVEAVAQALHLTEGNPEKLELEITESMFMNDNESVQRQLEQLHHMGIKLSLDDFGIGYSNLGYLQKFPLDCLKIDRSFLSDGEISPVLDLIVGVGRKLSLSVVAEGVETQVQRDFLVRKGCHRLQGFLFSKPIPRNAATALLKNSSATRNKWPNNFGVAA